MICHHPSETTLLDYAAGTLQTQPAHVVATHVAGCAECQAALRLLDGVGGALLDDLTPAPLAPGALDRIIARLDDDPPAGRASAPVAVMPTREALASGRWRWCGPGIRIMPLSARDASGTRLDLVRVAPGAALPNHGHSGIETLAVLQGAFNDGIETYKTGDFAEADRELHHRPRALAGLDCICLVATTGRLRPRGLLGRLMQPLLGM